MSELEILQSKYENMILKSFPYFSNYEYELKMIKFYKLANLEFDFKNGILFKFNIEDDKIIFFNLYINKGKTEDLLDFCKKFNNLMVEQSISIINIFNFDTIEFNYEVDNKKRKINAIFINETYKILLESSQYKSVNTNIYDQSNPEHIESKITIYSIKDKNHLVEKYKLCKVNNFNDFLSNIKFEVKSDLKRILSDMISKIYFTDFENLMDYYFEEIKKVKTLNTMLNY